MKNLEWAADAHCHWSDFRLYGTTDVAIPQMIEARIRIFQLGGVDPLVLPVVRATISSTL